MALMLGQQQINGLEAFAGWNSIQKKIRMRDRQLSTLVYDFYVDEGQAVLSGELEVLEAESAEAGNLSEN